MTNRHEARGPDGRPDAPGETPPKVEITEPAGEQAPRAYILGLSPAATGANSRSDNCRQVRPMRTEQECLALMEHFTRMLSSPIRRNDAKALDECAVCVLAWVLGRSISVEVNGRTVDTATMFDFLLRP